MLESMLTSVARNNSFNTNSATAFLCFSFRLLTAQKIIPIDEKLAKEKRNTDRISIVRSLN